MVFKLNRNKRRRMWVAQHKELDLRGEGRDPNEAVSNLMEMCLAYNFAGIWERERSVPEFPGADIVRFLLSRGQRRKVAPLVDRTVGGGAVIGQVDLEGEVVFTYVDRMFSEIMKNVFQIYSALSRLENTMKGD